MMYILCFAAGMMLSFILITILTGKPKLKKNEEKKKMQFLKILVAVVMTHGMVLSTMSYILSIMDKNTVYEVSTVIITEIIAPVMIYGITKTVENIFEKNRLKFSTPLSAEKEE